MTYGFSKAAAMLFMLLATAAIASPGVGQLTGHRFDDSFPISRFGMFARPAGPVQPIVYIRGTYRDGTVKPIEATRIWPGGMNTSWVRLNRVASSNRRRRDETCQEIVARMARGRRFRDVTKVEIVRAEFLVARYFGENDPTPVSERIVARCTTGVAP